MNCPICYSNSNRGVFNLYDDRYGYPGSYDLCRCMQCGHLFLDAEFSSDQLSTLYTDYYPRTSFSLDQFQPPKELSLGKSWINGEGRSAFRWVPENVRVLDIGCGFGQTLAYHKARGCDVYGVEADENIRRVADHFGFNVHVGLFDSSLYESNFFDYVTMDQVVEHLVDPLVTLKDISKVLKPGGVAVLSTPNATGWGARLFGRRWINWHAPYHLQHFSKRSMKVAAEQAGLEIVKVKTVTCSEWLYYQWIHLLTFPELGSRSSFWSPVVMASYFKRVLLKIVYYIHRSKINHIITRIFDAIHIGDNYLFIMVKK